MQRMDNDVRRLVVAHLDDHIGEVRLTESNAIAFEGHIHLNLIRGHRHNLDDFSGLISDVLFDQCGRDCVGLIGVTRPVNLSSSLLAIALKLLEIVIKMFEGMRLDIARGLPQLPPIWHLLDTERALGADGVRRVAHIAPKLIVPKRISERKGKGWSSVGVANSHAHPSTSTCEMISARYMVRTEEPLTMQTSVYLHQARIVECRNNLGSRLQDFFILLG